MFASRPAGRVSTQIFIRKCRRFFRFFTTNVFYLFLVFSHFLLKVNIKWTWVCYVYWSHPLPPWNTYSLSPPRSPLRFFLLLKIHPKSLLWYRASMISNIIIDIFCPLDYYQNTTEPFIDRFCGRVGPGVDSCQQYTKQLKNLTCYACEDELCNHAASTTSLNIVVFFLASVIACKMWKAQLTSNQ